MAKLPDYDDRKYTVGLVIVLPHVLFVCCVIIGMEQFKQAGERAGNLLIPIAFLAVVLLMDALAGYWAIHKRSMILAWLISFGMMVCYVLLCVGMIVTASTPYWSI